MKNPYCETLEYNPDTFEHIVVNPNKSCKRGEGTPSVKFAIKHIEKASSFTDGINQLIETGKVKVYTWDQWQKRHLNSHS